MQVTDSPPRRYEAAREAKILERVGGYYECQEVPFGVVSGGIQGTCCLSADAERGRPSPVLRLPAMSVMRTTPVSSEKSWLVSVWMMRPFILGTMLGTAKGLGYLVKPFLAVQAYCQVPAKYDKEKGVNKGGSV